MEERDKKMYSLVESIVVECNAWLDYVNATNQCAYSDRKLETILELANTLKEVYENDN